MYHEQFFYNVKYAQGKYQLINPEKYVGNKTPHYRSGWEHTFMTFCDNNPAVTQWASEAIQIPYRHPLTGKITNYIPDFFVMYENKYGKRIAEIVEIKPSSEVMETVGKSRRNQAMAALNSFKWEAARAWCAANNITFRIVTEADMFHNPKKIKKFKTRYDEK